MPVRDFREIQRDLGFNLSENGTLKFHFMTSLKEIAVAKVTSLLWMSQSTQQEIVNLFHSGICLKTKEFCDKWQQIESNVINKTPELCLPKSFPIKLEKIVLVLGNSILDWIKYHDRFTLKVDFPNSKYSAADLISHIAWTARGRIDLAKTAKNILTNQNSGLSDDQKYKLACTYCLEDEIAVLASKVLNRDYLDKVNVDMFPMVYYWATYVTGGDDNININQYKLKLLKTYKQLPVHIMYVWSKLNEQEKLKCIASVEKFGNQDLLYSLLSNLDYDQQQDVFREYSGPILNGILKDWLWEEYFFPVALHVLPIMDPISYCSTLNAIIDQMYEDYNYLYYAKYMPKDFFEVLWHGSSGHLKDYFLNNEVTLAFCCSLSWERDLDIIDLIFKDINNVQQRKEIIFDEDCMGKCLEFIQKDEWHLLELFMNRTLPSEEDIIDFKTTFAERHGGEIIFGYLSESDEAYDKIKLFMDWAFKSMEASNHFRQSLVRDAIIIMQSIIENKIADFTKLDNYFAWCANGDLELINRYKSEILDSFLIKHLIKENQYEFLDQLLNRPYSGNLQRITQFKRNIPGYERNVSEDSEMI